MKYLLNYGTGAGNEWHESLEEAKANVNFEYTQESVTIEDENGNEILKSKWWSVAYDPEEDENTPLAEFGNGYYAQWQEI